MAKAISSLCQKKIKALLKGIKAGARPQKVKSAPAFFRFFVERRLCPGHLPASAVSYKHSLKLYLYLNALILPTIPIVMKAIGIKSKKL